jgi:hypothetical protein
MSRDIHSLDFESREGYLYARATGIRTRQSVAAVTKMVFEKAVELGFPKVLVEVTNLEGTLSVLDSYSLVVDVFRSIRWRGITKAAVVDADGSRIQMAFSEIVARNRGYNYRIFTDKEQAIKWLLAA